MKPYLPISLFISSVPYMALMLLLVIILLRGWQLPVISIILWKSQGIYFKVFVQMKPHMASRVLWAWSLSLLAVLNHWAYPEENSTVSWKPVKIKGTCVSPKQQSSCVGIAQDEGLSSVLASEKARKVDSCWDPQIHCVCLLRRNLWLDS